MNVLCSYYTDISTLVCLYSIVHSKTFKRKRFSSFRSCSLYFECFPVNLWPYWLTIQVYNHSTAKVYVQITIFLSNRKKFSPQKFCRIWYFNSTNRMIIEASLMGRHTQVIHTPNYSNWVMIVVIKLWSHCTYDVFLNVNTLYDNQVIHSKSNSIINNKSLWY